MYVDDLLDSTETVETAQHLQNQLFDVLAMAGFNLRKWSSNEAAVIENVLVSDRLPTIDINTGEPPKTKTLGVMWEAARDVFLFQVKQPDMSVIPTKRSVLSAIAALYDPLQFLAPFVIRAKILMQEIWMAGLDWDDVLPSNLRMKWETWVSELQDLSHVAIPRCLRLPNPESVDLHLFSDASKDAFASVAYLVCHYPSSPSTSCLIASKCRVSPLKVVTIPRLELMGAILSSRLAKSILTVLTVDRVIYWTDSENVYYWVRNQSREFKPFVANRIGEIQRTTSPEQWHHVPGTMNPADLPTRGLSAADLSEGTFWIEGPPFLRDNETVWPKSPPSKDGQKFDVNERRSTAKTYAATKTDESISIDPSHFSSLKHLYRVTGWIKRFINNCKIRERSARNYGKTLSADEMFDAETFWIKHTQSEAFPNGVQEKSLVQLNPTKDDNGLLRINGRLHHAEGIPHETKHPILLPKNHPLTRLIVIDAHETLGHGSGVEHTLTQLRARFWVVKGRRVVRNIIQSCPACRRRFSVKTAGQMMAPLPEARLYSLRAFDRIGIDYAGPFLTKQGRGKTRAKRYLCLFTCLTTRAVHLEMSYSLDTTSFINAFTRMTSRRGTPTYVITDNGTNFVGA